MIHPDLRHAQRPTPVDQPPNLPPPFANDAAENLMLRLDLERAQDAILRGFKYGVLLGALAGVAGAVVVHHFHRWFA